MQTGKDSSSYSNRRSKHLARTGTSVLVTGAARGLGFALADAFHRAGAWVVLNDLDTEGVEHAIARLGATDRLAPAAGDISAVAGCEAAVQQALDAFGRLDVLVNNAAIFRDASIQDTDERLWDATVDVILKGTFFCSRAASPALREAGGSIVNVASELGLRGGRRRAAYCAAKAGVINLTRAMALELAPHVRVNAVSPGTIDTEMTRESAEAEGDIAAAYERWAAAAPLARIGNLDEVVDAIMFLAGPEARFVTGANLSVDGGSMAGR